MPHCKLEENGIIYHLKEFGKNVINNIFKSDLFNIYILECPRAVEADPVVMKKKPRFAEADPGVMKKLIENPKEDSMKTETIEEADLFLMSHILLIKNKAKIKTMFQTIKLKKPKC